MPFYFSNAVAFAVAAVTVAADSSGLLGEKPHPRAMWRAIAPDCTRLAGPSVSCGSCAYGNSARLGAYKKNYIKFK